MVCVKKMNKKSYTITKPCDCCKTTGKIKSYGGKLINCPYCKGSGYRTLNAVHPSHQMSEFRCEILAPAGTPRFYNVRHCVNCEKEEWKHAAGHFFHGLNFPCIKDKL